MLSNIISKKKLNVIGLNAGTSADGLDLAAVRVDILSKTPAVKFIAGRTIRYPQRLYSIVGDAIYNKIKSIDEIIILDRMLGTFYGEQADRFCGLLKQKGFRPDIIASHGQTVRHLPGKVRLGRKNESGSLQLGHPETIASQTGLATVADFRQGDIAAGGEGAPITGWAMWHLFSSRRESRLLLNIGGIANFFLLPRNASSKKLIAADCGPGNSIIDIVASKLFGKKYDSGGKMAARGKISKRLLTILMADNFLKGRYGPSTGRERFGAEFAERTINIGSRLRLNKHDIIATATELTVAGIVRSIRKHITGYGLKNIYLFGGGSENKFIRRRLKINLPDVDIFSVDRLGYNPDFLEAICYAVMGAMTISGQVSTLSHIGGARMNTIAGRIIQPPRRVR